MPERHRATTLTNSVRSLKSHSEYVTHLHVKMFTREGSVLSPAYNFRLQGRKLHSLCLQAFSGLFKKREKEGRVLILSK